MSHLTGEVKRLMTVITKYDQDNYPEMLGRICIINAPLVFKALWSLVKPMLNPRTISKIQAGGLPGVSAGREVQPRTGEGHMSRRERCRKDGTGCHRWVVVQRGGKLSRSCREAVGKLLACVPYNRRRDGGHPPWT